MDVALFAALAVIGAFIPLRKLIWLRYSAEREENQRLYYRAAIIAIWLVVAGWLLNAVLMGHSARYKGEATGLTDGFLVPLLEKVPDAPAPPTSKEHGKGAGDDRSPAVRVRAEFARACVAAFLLGCLSPLLNWPYTLHRRFFRPPDALRDQELTLAEFRRSLELILNYESMRDNFDMLMYRYTVSQRPVQITLSSGKVYVGRVMAPPIPNATRKSFRLQPYLSGFRDPGDGRIQYTTNYYPELEAIEVAKSDEEREKATALAELFQVLLFADSVISMSGFDLQSHKRFQERELSAPSVELPPQRIELSGEVRVAAPLAELRHPQA